MTVLMVEKTTTSGLNACPKRVRKERVKMQSRSPATGLAVIVKLQTSLQMPKKARQN